MKPIYELFEDFITQYIDYLIDLDNLIDIGYKLSEEDKKEIVKSMKFNDYFWEWLDNELFYQFEDYKKECD